MNLKSNSFTNIPPSKIFTGPFRATRIWNEIVKTFTENMPLRSHRRQFKLVHNCFTAARAVDFMQEVLKQNKNTPENITREQVITKYSFILFLIYLCTLCAFSFFVCRLLLFRMYAMLYASRLSIRPI